MSNEIDFFLSLIKSRDGAPDYYLPTQIFRPSVIPEAKIGRLIILQINKKYQLSYFGFIDERIHQSHGK